MSLSIDEALGIMRESLNTTRTIMESFNGDEFVKEVNTLCGPEPEYKELDIQAEIINNAKDISTKEKCELLDAITDKKIVIRDKELEHKYESAKNINKACEDRCIIFATIFFGVLTGGASLIPQGCMLVDRWINNKLTIEPRNK